jgi:hypothetical protein
MTESNTSKAETIWDAIFNRTINSKNLVPFCIIFALTTYLFLGHDSINKRFFILNSLKQEEFAWFSFYALITLASIGITRLCDKLGILKAITLFPVLSDLVYYCILDYREMKDNFRSRVNGYYFNNHYANLENVISLDRSGKSESIPECLQEHYYKIRCYERMLLVILKFDFKANIEFAKEILNDEYESQFAIILKSSFEDVPKFAKEISNDSAKYESQIVCSVIFILLKHLCHPKHRINTKEDIKTHISNHVKHMTWWDYNLSKMDTLVQITQDFTIDVINKAIDQAIKYGILREEKDGTLFMPRGMVRYFDSIEYGFFYERKYPVLKCIWLGILTLLSMVFL